MAAAATEPRGLKRICPSCGTRYYDMNKRPPACPSCATEFKTEVKTKGRRARPVANDEVKAAPVAKPAADEDNIEVVEGDEETVSLTDVEDMEDDDAAEDEEIESLDSDLDIEEDDLGDDDDADDEDEEDEEEDEE